MTGNSVENQVEQLLAPLAEAQNAVVDAVALTGSGNSQVLTVTVDLERVGANLSSDQVASLAREFSRALDEHDPIEGAYTLEVTSPGADRELTNLNQYHRSVGREVKVVLKNKDHVQGQMTAVDNDGFTVEGPDGARTIAFDDVKKAQLVVETPREG
ncbi:ribosome maturation factor RimP [Actinomyces minihominis]|uniref:ribosome maturation factor RimP n=1 Tax=Actinomyces minihominis TaxID=2002838 RepID=UPI0013EB4A67|nr:ribosome maturation factor RimP [Actinomyces minihominis]